MRHLGDIDISSVDTTLLKEYADSLPEGNMHVYQYNNNTNDYSWNTVPAEALMEKNDFDFSKFWNENGKYLLDSFGNIVNATTGIIVAAKGSYNPNLVTQGSNGYLTLNKTTSSGMSAMTKMFIFGGVAAAMIVGAIIYKKNKKNKKKK